MLNTVITAFLLSVCASKQASGVRNLESAGSAPTVEQSAEKHNCNPVGNQVEGRLQDVDSPPCKDTFWDNPYTPTLEPSSHLVLVTISMDLEQLLYNSGLEVLPYMAFCLVDSAETNRGA